MISTMLSYSQLTEINTIAIVAYLGIHITGKGLKLKQHNDQIHNAIYSKIQPISSSVYKIMRQNKEKVHSLFYKKLSSETST